MNPERQKRLLIAPSILSGDFGRLADEVKAIEAAGADYIHLDVMDGVFVPEITFGQKMVEALARVTNLPLDVHLMMVEPDRHLDSFAAAGAKYITVHAEACVHLHRTLSLIKSLGCGAGVALNPHTPEEGLRYVVDELDLILVMTVNPGFGGQKFIPGILSKIERIKDLTQERGRGEIILAVDGGVNTDNAGPLHKAGADLLVAGNAVFTADGRYAENITRLRAARPIVGSS